MISGSYWSRNAWLTEIYNLGFIEICRCLGTYDYFLLENQINLIEISKASANLNKTELVNLCEPCITRSVAPRDHYSNAG